MDSLEARVVNYCLERSNCVGLLCEGARFFDARQITHKCRAGARHCSHRLLRSVLVAPMQDDVMAQRHETLCGKPSKAIGGARYETLATITEFQTTPA
jgi:hypothetical protein